jgi:hypothetical protein
LRKLIVVAGTDGEKRSVGECHDLGRAETVEHASGNSGGEISEIGNLKFLKETECAPLREPQWMRRSKSLKDFVARMGRARHQPTRRLCVQFCLPAFHNGNLRLVALDRKFMRKPRTPKREQSGSDEAAVHYYNPSSAEEVIASHLRQQRHTEKILREMTKQKGPNPQLVKGPLGLNEAELTAIRQEAVAHFFDGAKLSEELREKRIRNRERFDSRKPDDNYQAELAAVLFARDCEVAVGKAVGEFSDMLTQAVIARYGRKDFSLKLRTRMWAECLRFAMRLARFETAGVWIDKAWGTDPRESPLPHLYRLETIQEQQAAATAWSAKFKVKFEERIRHGSRSWLNEAERKMELRCMLSSAPQRGAMLDKSKRALALLLTTSPGLTTQQMCGKLDVYNERSPGRVPIPTSWERRGAHSWIDAFEKIPASVKTYASSVRRALGITKGSSGAN